MAEPGSGNIRILTSCGVFSHSNLPPSSSRAAPGSPSRGGATGRCTPGMDTIPNHWHSDKVGTSSQGWQLTQMPARSLRVPAPQGHLSHLHKARQLSPHL